MAEDSDVQALRFELLFSAQGWKVERAASADEAVELANNGRPDLILVSPELSGLTGSEVCKQIREKAPYHRSIIRFTEDDLPIPQETETDTECLSESTDTELVLGRVRDILLKAEKGRKKDAGTELRAGRILAVDDSPSFLEYLVHQLSSDGHTVDAASSGPEALDRIKATSYDCVLLDLLMPGMNGTEVCRAVTQMGTNLPSVPLVLMLTAHEEPNELAKGLESGADDFVGKSSNVIILKSRVRALLRRKQFQNALRDKDIEVARANAAREAAEVKASLATQISEKNRELEEAYKKLKNTQMHLVQAAKMASLGQLVAGIAHEINNPIGFINNNYYLISEKLEKLAEVCAPFLEPSDAKLIKTGRDRLAESRIGLDRVKELVNKLRTFSRLDEGEFKRIDVPESIESVLLLLKHRNHGIEFDKQFSGDRMLDCAPGLLNQVLMNLVSNAIEAIADGAGTGKITIRTAVEDGWYLISVRDTGTGIPDSVRPRLFEPFFTTKPIGQGTGLGLAISHSIIQAHKGEIEAINPDGGGAEFRIRIPTNLSEDVVHEIKRRQG